MGFKFSSLMKLADVKAKAASGITLLHTIAGIIQEKEPELLTFVEEMDHVASAESGKMSKQVYYLILISPQQSI